MNNKIMKYFDLFSGIGGFHQATKHVQIDNLEFQYNGHCEIDKQAKEFYKKVHAVSNKVEVSDVKDIKTHKNKNAIELDPFDLLFAGFPCQSFSNVGYRKGLDDERGQLFYNILNILEYYSPKYFILENVQKIATMKEGNVIDEMTQALENIGMKYHLHLWDLNAKDYGVPQNRRRMFFCGVRSDISEKKDISKPLKIDLNSCLYPTTWHLLEKNNIDEKHQIPKKTRETVLYKNDKWCGNVDINNLIARPITASMSKWHRANQDNYFSLNYIEATTPHEEILVNLEKDKIRRITPLEGFRLQGFPDYFATHAREIKLSNSAQYRLIGNSVPVTMVEKVIEHFFINYKE
jgi:DNA (cytosine-5)-methyltransferase 1